VLFVCCLGFERIEVVQVLIARVVVRVSHWQLRQIHLRRFSLDAFEFGVVALVVRNLSFLNKINLFLVLGHLHY
jgi:hypothetical protein